MIQTAKETRKQAYLALVDQLPARRKEVYNLIQQKGGVTAHELRKILGVGLNQVTGRISELQAVFLIQPIGAKINEETGVVNTLWATTSPVQREVLKKKELARLEAELDALRLDDSVLFVSTLVKDLIHKEKARVASKIKELKAA